jgi:hypothetical protein
MLIAKNVEGISDWESCATAGLENKKANEESMATVHATAELVRGFFTQTVMSKVRILSRKGLEAALRNDNRD